MYATVRIYADAPGLADAVTEHQSEIRALFEEIPGFRHYAIVKTGAATAISMTVCDDQAGAEATNEAARDWITANLSDMKISPPEVHGGEVPMSIGLGAHAAKG